MSATNSRLFCTFINEKSGTGSITIAKTTLGGDGTFEFIGFMDFTITTVTGSGSQTFANLDPGTYTVRELLGVRLAGWEVTDIQCTGAATPAVISLPAHSATITLAAGENVVCTFTDTKTGSITINKSTVGGEGSFRFATTGNGLSDFIIVTAGGAGAHAFNALLPGVYTVTELVPSGWNPPTLTCTGTATPVSIAGTTATIMLATGESAVCTYTDTSIDPRKSAIVINKRTNGGDDTFHFTGSGIAAFAITTAGGVGQKMISGLAAGTYTVTETPSNTWLLSSLSCTDPTGDTTWDLNTATATIRLVVGETVVCTFTNSSSVPIPVLGTWLYLALGSLLLVTGWFWVCKCQAHSAV